MSKITSVSQVGFLSKKITSLVRSFPIGPWSFNLTMLLSEYPFPLIHKLYQTSNKGVIHKLQKGLFNINN